MADLHHTTTLFLGEKPSIAHHCDHDNGNTSWRVEGISGGDMLYFNGTPQQLLAFGQAIEQEAKAILFKELPEETYEQHMAREEPLL